MPVTTVAMVMNIAVGFSAWQSQLPVLIKTIITAVLIGEYALFFYSVWICESEWMRKCSIVMCIGLTIALIVCFLLYKEVLVAVTTGIVLVMLIIWAVAVTFDFTNKCKRDD